MNINELKSRIDARHYYLMIAKKLSKISDSRYEFFTDLAEREQKDIDKLEEYSRTKKE